MTTVQQLFPIVGIGASAGGVEAFEGFFNDMPSDTGMAFVLVTHMPRGYETTLPDIISRFTDMPVRNARNGETVEPDHVYVCPADHTVTIKQGRLHLEARLSDHQRKPIDVFLGSLAEERGENAIGIILSGGGSDGALGIKAIKERGGLALAQGTDGSGPRQSSMPESAIATGLIDLILPVEDMADRLVEFSRSARHEAKLDREPQEADPTEIKNELAAIRYKQIGHDSAAIRKRPLCGECAAACRSRR